MEILNVLVEKIVEAIVETKFNELILYRGVENKDEYPSDDDYTFFAKNKSFAEDYGRYVWKCHFGKLNLFISYELEYIEELYANGYKLRDEYVEDMWDDVKDNYEEIYDYGTENDGYKSAEAVASNPHSGSDTWEMIEVSHGVIDYIISKYDGVVLLEGGELTYYLDTTKILKCERVLKLAEQYQGEHEAPNKDDSPLHDLSGLYPEDIYSVNAQRFYGDFSDEYSDMESLSIIWAARNKPKMLVKIYRAVPDVNKDIDMKIKKLTDITRYYDKFGFFPMKNKTVHEIEEKYDNISDYDLKQQAILNHIFVEIDTLVKNKNSKLKINDGDWVTINKNYAKFHGKTNLNNNFKILSKTVRARDIYSSGDSIHEWGYSPN